MVQSRPAHAAACAGAHAANLNLSAPSRPSPRCQTFRRPLCTERATELSPSPRFLRAAPFPPVRAREESDRKQPLLLVPFSPLLSLPPLQANSKPSLN
mmetsp:Transcript_18122/g.54675  ORF Transcript_18122/g.54675 Transcript_18122/m.54675 type:complete len:98 (+) Transcript_18122:2225-2518(+)